MFHPGINPGIQRKTRAERPAKSLAERLRAAVCVVLIVLMLALPPTVVSQPPQAGSAAAQPPGVSVEDFPGGASDDAAGAAQQSPGAAQQSPGAEPLLLNFRNVEIRQIIESVGELTGANFLIDPRVRGKVTILANEPVPQNALYDVMLSILRMHNFRAVKIEGENLTRILPANVAPRFKPEFLDGDPLGESERLVTTIIRVKHLNAASIIPMIKPLMTPEAQVLIHKPTNRLLITEVNSSLERVRTIIDRIDIAELDDFEIINLVYAEAKDVVGLLQRASNKELRHLVQVVADNKGNRIILTGPVHVRRSLRALIAELDTETSVETTGRIKVINLHYARAEDVEKVVKGLLSSTEFIKTLGGEDDDLAVETAPAKKEEPKPAEKKEDKKDAAKDDPKPAEKKTEVKAKTSNKRNYVIQVDKALNALIVGGPPKVIAAVERVVRDLDVPRPQVLIEAIFADTSEQKRVELGSQLGGGRDVGVGSRVVTEPRPGENAGTRIVRGVGLNYPGGEAGVTIGGQALIGGNVLNFILSFLRTDEDSRVLSTPSILTLNNEEAMIDVSDELSITTGTIDSANVDSRATTTFERRKFGTTLKVTPQITRGDAVRLDIEYKTEDVGDRTGGGTTPDTKSREVKTTVLVNDGDVLILGGLSNESATEDETRVPLLSNIPVVGHLFRDRQSGRNKTTLMVFIRPTILRNADEGGERSRERYAGLRLEQLMDAQAEETLLPDEDMMVLPGLPGRAEPARPGAAGEARPAKRKKKILKRKKRRSGGSG